MRADAAPPSFCICVITTEELLGSTSLVLPRALWRPSGSCPSNGFKDLSLLRKYKYFLHGIIPYLPQKNWLQFLSLLLMRVLSADQLARSSVQCYNSTDCPYKRNLVKLKTWVGWFYSNNWKLSASSGYSKATSAVMELADVSMYCSQCSVPSKRKINFLPKGSCCQGLHLWW